jgi:zinc transport system ATP-binding protein
MQTLVTPGDSIVELKDVDLTRGGNRVLEKVSFRIQRGDWVGIIGPNGAGKTTLLRVILGMIRPEGGSVSLFDTPIREFRRWHQVAYLPQKVTNFDPKFPVTVEEVVAMGRVPRLSLWKRMGRADWDAVERALDFTSVADLRRRQMGTLSGGQQQRVFIARALAAEPELLMLDEPTASVDTGATLEFYGLLRRLNQEMGITILHVSHDVSAVMDYCNALCCLNRVCYYGRDPKAMLESGEFAQVLSEVYGEHARFVVHRH